MNSPAKAHPLLTFTYTEATWPPAQSQPQKFEFIKWRSDQRAFFLRNESGALVVATPDLPNLAGDWEFPKCPFPERAVVAVRPYRLIPPPVKADPSAPPAARWEILYGREHRLCTTPEDQPALQKLLDQENAARRAAYRDRVDPKNLKQEWARLKGGERAQAKRQPGFKQFCQQRRQLLDERGLNRDLTMADLLRNPEGILGDYLRQRWAEQMGINLMHIGYVDPARPCEGWRSAPARFLAWMRAHCPAISRPLSPEEARRSLLLELDDPPSQSFPEVFTEIELLATVRYVAEFENGERVFLADLEIRDPRADELEEIRTLQSFAETTRRGSEVPWHSDCYRTVRWPEKDGSLKPYYLTKTQAAIVGVLDKAAHKELAIEDVIQRVWCGEGHENDHPPDRARPWDNFRHGDAAKLRGKLLHRDRGMLRLTPPW
jgi:hypothetical protein